MLNLNYLIFFVLGFLSEMQVSADARCSQKAARTSNRAGLASVRNFFWGAVSREERIACALKQSHRSKEGNSKSEKEHVVL
jgi:hypothetical protein